MSEITEQQSKMILQMAQEYQEDVANRIKNLAKTDPLKAGVYIGAQAIMMAFSKKQAQMGTLGLPQKLQRAALSDFYEIVERAASIANDVGLQETVDLVFEQIAIEINEVQTKVDSLV